MLSRPKRANRMPPPGEACRRLPPWAPGGCIRFSRFGRDSIGTWLFNRAFGLRRAARKQRTCHPTSLEAQLEADETPGAARGRSVAWGAPADVPPATAIGAGQQVDRQA